MKKIYYLMAMAMMAFTFTSCEDVPEPFGQPINPNGPEEVIEPTGTGTEADPFNIAAAIEKCQEVGETGSSEKSRVLPTRSTLLAATRTSKSTSSIQKTLRLHSRYIAVKVPKARISTRASLLRRVQRLLSMVL